MEGQIIQLFFVDDISITFLYVSSSDLVLKNNNTKDYIRNLSFDVGDIPPTLRDENIALKFVLNT